MVLSQISNKFHKFQPITKPGKEIYNVRQTGKNVDYKYPIFCKQTLQSLNEHKSGFQLLMTCLNSLMESISFIWDGILLHNFEPMYDKPSNPWLTVLERGIAIMSNSTYCIDFVVSQEKLLQK